MVKKVFFVFCLLLMMQTCFADWSQPFNLCSAPYKPYQFSSEAELELFKAQVNRYKVCIEDFVREQERAIKNHQNAANKAIEDWNDFVRRMKY